MRGTASKTVWRLASCLLLALQATIVAAGETRGVMAVSLTVQASCAVNVISSPIANSEKQPLSITANIFCPQGFPYQAKISSKLMRGIMNDGNAPHAFLTGEQHLEVAQLLAQSTSRDEASFNVLSLTISY